MVVRKSLHRSIRVGIGFAAAASSYVASCVLSLNYCHAQNPVNTAAVRNPVPQAAKSPNVPTSPNVPSVIEPKISARQALAELEKLDKKSALAAPLPAKKRSAKLSQLDWDQEVEVSEPIAPAVDFPKAVTAPTRSSVDEEEILRNLLKSN